jgi:mannose-1-phosphate guanylyltransferase
MANNKQRFTLHASRFTKDIYAVILVGGKGKRLQPLSTHSRPKAFLCVTRDGKTMFHKTVDRISRLIPRKDIVVVANSRHAALVRKNFPGIRKDNLLLEPVSRNTAPAIALAALALKDRSADAIMVVLPSDHYITREGAYLEALRSAVSFVKRNRRSIVTLGVRPNYPATGYGYIKLKAQSSKLKGICKVEKFTEKPDIKTAERFTRSGLYLWNAGMFVFGVREILKNFEDFTPQILRAFTAPDGGKIRQRYKNLPDISIDYAVMENSRDIYCARGRFGWKDIGSFGALKEILLLERRPFREKLGKVTEIL